MGQTTFHTAPITPRKMPRPPSDAGRLAAGRRCLGAERRLVGAPSQRQARHADFRGKLPMARPFQTNRHRSSHAGRRTKWSAARAARVHRREQEVRMRSITTLVTTLLSKTRLLGGDLDYHLLRASMVIIFFFFGYQKWWDYEAQTLIPYISN